MQKFLNQNWAVTDAYRGAVSIQQGSPKVLWIIINCMLKIEDLPNSRDKKVIRTDRKSNR